MEEEEKKITYIQPDYDSGDDDDDDEIFDESDSDENEGAAESILDTEIGNEEKKEMVTATTPFGTTPASTPAWGGNSGANPSPWGTTPWGSGNNSWNKPSNPSPWGTTSPWGTQSGQKQEINREKKIIFIDFLDCIVETWQSNGQPGLLPRDIYDLKPRFDVWTKLSMFGPQKIYMLIPKNLLTSTNGIEGWKFTMEYYCCCVSSFLRIPFTCCQVLAQSRIGQPKGEIISSILKLPNYQDLKDSVLSIGIYSGLPGQSNIDKIAADYCGIDHLDLNQLLNNMY